MADEEVLLNYDDAEEETTNTNAGAKGGASGGASAAGASAAAGEKKGDGGGSNAPKKNYSVAVNSFRDFYLKSELLQAINRHGFEHPTQVQQECLPQAVLGLDLVCQAQSGMGKTAVFVLSTLQQLLENPGEGVQVLVLCHTRELAYQIAKEYERFCPLNSGISTQVVYGGVPIQTHRALFAQKEVPQIIVGTPGRVLALVEEKSLKLNKIRHFVLDECDSLVGKDSLDMRRDIQAIFKQAPREKQVMMFTATLNDDTRAVCKMFMRNPVEIIVNEESKLFIHGLQQHYIKLTETEKAKKLIELLDALEFNQVMIFTKSSERAKAVTTLLNSQGFPAKDLHSHMAQDERIQRFKDFKETRTRILVSTNLSGRGIDVAKVNIVVNYDMPESPESYLHRVGRTARCGTKGLAITFTSSDEDNATLNAVQERFEVAITPLPSSIDPSVYMNA